jgi:crossover junction endodeoxyribonuclease RuvC
MVVMGVDPGWTKPNPTGIALVDSSGELLDRCVHVPDQSIEWPKRIPAIVEFLVGYLDEHKRVQALAYEIPFVGHNPLVGVMLAHIGGIVQALAWEYTIPCVMVRPAQAKMALTGHGGATKEMMVREAGRRFGVSMTKDEADAVGIALAAMEILKEANYV